MASARRVGTSENVNTYGTGGRNYTSLATWEAATDNDLVTATQSEVLECYDDAASFDDKWVAWQGATTNSSYFRIVRPAAGEGHDGTPTVGVWFKYTTAANGYIVNEDYGSFQDCIVTQNINSGSNRYTASAAKATSDLIGIICWDSVNSGAGSSRGIIASLGSAIVCLADNSEDWNFWDGGNSQGGSFLNCTSIDAGGNGFHISASSTNTWKNCLSHNSGSSDFAGTAGTQDYNAASDATANGANSRDSQTFTFVDATNHDYQLASGDAGAKDYGVDLSGTFDDDLAGATWVVSWDIGCLQAAAAAGGTILPQMMAHHGG
jgi:hypothetical protein